METIIKVFPTPGILAESLAIHISGMIKDSGSDPLPFTIALSGGTTPVFLFSVLGERFSDSVDWKGVHFFWVDERCVSPDHPDSNFRLARDYFLRKIDIPRQNIHRIRGEDDPRTEAERYSAVITRFAGKKRNVPYFNIVLLGIGEDGHTASLFPGNDILLTTEDICITAVHPNSGQKRISLTGKVINNSENIIFMATGTSKAAIVNHIIGDSDNKKQFPASYIKPVDGKFFWYLDKEAGSMICDQSGLTCYLKDD
jgi:6-phosphogluconolactonase